MVTLPLHLLCTDSKHLCIQKHLKAYSKCLLVVNIRLNIIVQWFFLLIWCTVVFLRPSFSRASQPLTGLPQSWPVLQVAMIPWPARQRATDTLNTALIYNGRIVHAHMNLQELRPMCATSFLWKLKRQQSDKNEWEAEDDLVMVFTVCFHWTCSSFTGAFCSQFNSWSAQRDMLVSDKLYSIPHY